MLNLIVTGIVREEETEIGLSGLVVQVHDRESRFAHLFARTCTGEAGRFVLAVAPQDFGDFLDVRPDLYLKVFAPGATVPMYQSETPVRWIGWQLEEFDIRIPRDQLGTLAPERGIRLFADDRTERNEFDVGEPLLVQIAGVHPIKVHNIVTCDTDGTELSTSSLLSNQYGTIPSTVIWPQFGLDDPRTGEVLNLDQGQNRWHGRELQLRVLDDHKVVLERGFRIADNFTRPLLYSSDADGAVLNGFDVGTRDTIIAGYNLASSGQIRIYMVPRQHDWWPGDTFVPVKLASGRSAFIDIELYEGQMNFRTPIANAGELYPGAYDFIVRQLRYGYEDDEDFRLRTTDFVAYRCMTGLVVREDFMRSKVIYGGCVNKLPISGRRLYGSPYFQYTDTFQVGEDIYGALDPAALSPTQQAKMVALYVIKHPTPQSVQGAGGLPTIPLPWDRIVMRPETWTRM